MVAGRIGDRIRRFLPGFPLRKRPGHTACRAVTAAGPPGRRIRLGGARGRRGRPRGRRGWVQW